jgi:hypothetical protein
MTKRHKRRRTERQTDRNTEKRERCTNRQMALQNDRKAKKGGKTDRQKNKKT